MARDSPNKSMSNYLPISTAAASVPLSRALVLQGYPSVKHAENIKEAGAEPTRTLSTSSLGK